MKLKELRPVAFVDNELADDYQCMDLEPDWFLQKNPSVQYLESCGLDRTEPNPLYSVRQVNEYARSKVEHLYKKYLQPYTREDDETIQQVIDEVMK